MTTKVAVTRTMKTSHSTMLHLTVIIAFIASNILSVSAIRCHQCNSHLEEDCVALRLNTPRAPRDEQYLKDCLGENAFCRKTVTEIEVTKEKRIVRGCGYIEDTDRQHEDDCFDADNEGFQQRVCACYQDGCNAAPSLYASKGTQLILIGVTIVSVFSGVLMRRSA